MRMGNGIMERGAGRTMLVAVISGAFLVPTAAHAAEYYLQFSLTGSTNPSTFNNTSAWFDQASGGGEHPATLNGHSFFTNGFTARGSNQNYTFGNESTELHFNSKLLVRGSSTAATIHNLTSYAGNPQIAAGDGAVSVIIGHFSNNVSTRITGDSISNRKVYLTAATLSGIGDFVLDNNGTLFALDVEDASSFTGNFTWAGTNSAILDFDNAFSSGGGLIVPTTGRIVLDQDITFASVTLGGIALAPDTYSYSQLRADPMFGVIFSDVPAGSEGSITVVPEPASLALAACGGLLVLRRRRTR